MADKLEILDWEKLRNLPPKEIFQSVCDALGAHFQQKGFSYSRSRPKLTWKDKAIKLEINFWSSRSNQAGESLNLEILPYFYSQHLKNKNTGKGLIVGHSELFYHPGSPQNPRLIKVIKIYGDILERIDEHAAESQIIESNNCNLYAIDVARFESIVRFIENRILVWIPKIRTREGILELLDNMSESSKRSLWGTDTNMMFREYVQLSFPDLDINSLLPAIKK